MKILVTGANGQVGFCLQQELANGGHDFLALPKSELDISNLPAVIAYCQDYRPNIIINAAAYTAVDKAESDQENAYKINRDGAANLASAANEIDAAIFHISTDYVFSGSENGFYKESDTTNPQGIYGKSKLDGELAVISANKKHIILRTAWVFGEHGNNFVKTMLRLGKTRDVLGVVADQYGGPTYAGDISKALVKIASQYETNPNLNWGVYHYSGAPHTNWFEFASAIFEKANEQCILNNPNLKINPIATADYPTPAKRPANSKLDCNKIDEIFGIKPSAWSQALDNISAYG